MATTAAKNQTATAPATTEAPTTEIKKAANPLESSNPTVKVGAMINNFLNNKTLVLPKDYSPDNALKQAWLELQNVKDRNGNLALQSCTQASVINALLDMVVQGLSVGKKQGYFIAYGNQLSFQRSYFGDQALAKRVNPDIEFYQQVIYEGDKVQIQMLSGRTVIMSHQTEFGNSDQPIKGAYCGCRSRTTGEDLGAVVMTIAEIKKSWGMSKTYDPSGQKGTHNQFPAEMALRTVIRKRCKAIINTSNDALLLASVRHQDADTIEAEMDAEIEANANGEILSLEAGPVEATAVQHVDPDTGEVIPANTVRDDQPTLDGEGAPF